MIYLVLCRFNLIWESVSVKLKFWDFLIRKRSAGGKNLIFWSRWIVRRKFFLHSQLINLSYSALSWLEVTDLFGIQCEDHGFWLETSPRSNWQCYRAVTLADEASWATIWRLFGVFQISNSKAPIGDPPGVPLGG